MNKDTRLTKIGTAAVGVVAAGSAWAAPTKAPNEPVFTATVGPESGDLWGSQQGFDIDGDGTDDFGFGIVNGGGCNAANNGGVLMVQYGGNVVAASEDSGYYYASMVAPGTSVTGLSFRPSSDRGTTTLMNCYDYGNSAGEWSRGSRGFVGVQFDIGGNSHLGYLDVEIADVAGSLQVITHSACYESTPDTDLDVGACLNREATFSFPDSSTGTLTVTTSDNTGEITVTPSAVDVASLGTPPPTDLTFVNGVTSFTIGNLSTVGGSVDITIDYGTALPAGTQIWKFASGGNLVGRTNDSQSAAKNGIAGSWREITGTVSGSTISYTLTDGGPNDADGVANGVIVDPVGAAAPMARGTPNAIPVGGVVPMALGILALGAAGVRMRRRQAA